MRLDKFATSSLGMALQEGTDTCFPPPDGHNQPLFSQFSYIHPGRFPRFSPIYDALQSHATEVGWI